MAFANRLLNNIAAKHGKQASPVIAIPCIDCQCPTKAPTIPISIAPFCSVIELLAHLTLRRENIFFSC